MVAHRRGARLLAIVVAIIIAAALALVLAHGSTGSAHTTALARVATGSGIPKPSPAVAAARRRRARADAATLLGRARLPDGSQQLTSEPGGDGGTLSRPASRPAATPTLVDEHTWWRVPGSAASVLAYVHTHVPRGGKLRESASQGPKPGDAVSGYVGFAWPPVGRLLVNRELLVQVTNLAGGGAGVRVDAQVQWIIPRPASERIPSGAHEVDVTRGAPGQAPSLEVKVVASDEIRALEAMVDALGIVQPGAYSCPALPAGGPVVTFTFRTSDGGAVLARASQPASSREPTTPCDPMTFSIRGHQRTPLLGGAAVLHAAGRLLGVRLQTEPGPVHAMGGH